MKYLVLGVLLAATGCAHFSQAIENGRFAALSDRPTPQAKATAHYLASVLYERNGKFDQAIREMRKALELAPDARSLQMKLIAYYSRLQEYDKALDVAEKAVAVNPNDDAMWVWMGIINQQLGHYDAAVAALHRAIDLNPQNALGYEALIALQEQTNDWVGAIDLYKELIQLVPESPALHYQLGLSYLRINDRADAVPALERAIELNPRFAPPYFVLGLSRFEEQDWPQAEQAFRHYLGLSPRDPRGYVHLAAVLARESRFDDSLTLLNVLTMVSSTDPSFALQRMFVLLLAGKYEEVESALPKSGSSEPATGAPASDSAEPAAPKEGAPILTTLFRGIARKLQGQPYEEIINSLDGIDGDLDREIDDYLNEILFLYGAKPAGDFLVQQLQAFRDQGIVSNAVDLTLARVYINQGRDADAAPVLAALAEREPANKLPHYYLATVYEALDNFDGAERELRACLAIDPKDAEVMNFLGYMYADADKKLDEAEDLLKQALAIDPDNGYYLDSMGWVYYRQGKAKLAIKYIQKAILAMESDDAELRNHLGDAYLLNGEVDKAVREWSRARRLNHELEGVQEKLDKYAPQPAKP